MSNTRRDFLKTGAAAAAATLVAPSLLHASSRLSAAAPLIVAPTAETFHQRTYPLVNAVYLYLNRPAGRPVPPRLKEFLAFVLSREGQQAIVDDGMFIPLTADAVREEMKKLE